MSRVVRRPVPLFMDVDGSLLACPTDTGEADPRLRTGRPDLDFPDDLSYPTRIWFDPEVVAGLNKLVNEGPVQLIWASTWDHAANRLLVPAVGLLEAPYDVAEIGTRYGGQMAAGIWVKALAVGRWLLENGLQNAPIVMVDDLLTSHASGFLSPHRRSIEVVGGGQNLFIETQPEQGLHVAQVAEIRSFSERIAQGTFS
ncbi:HAD domain-containing protein [Cryobacterium sp. TMS1-13-1]|uniref:HAD domain-containing protein n=1 Tax=Cryobacterium sp. TMS1-13-1 TaxID=1259220 RepID=UPI00106C3F1F|nr:HAD domain-containing protein [Cryobacterium sp. TMS1-13-1]TFD21294.1 hypothetical protein E3T31_10675 [Cryobacterium sp. TMS1-13-1]